MDLEVISANDRRWLNSFGSGGGVFAACAACDMDSKYLGWGR